MSSVAKRLREVAEMRELKIEDRSQYRYQKWLAQDPDRAERYFKSREKQARPEHREETRKRSELALQQLSGGVTLCSFAKALKVFIQGKV
ncbi:MAG: hypothetical protein AMXMBFR56_61920 [Polyangiaceae bacterium]